MVAGGLRQAFKDVAAKLLAVEPYFHADTRQSGLRQLRRDCVVEGTVQMRQRRLDNHRSYRVDACQLRAPHRLLTGRETLEEGGLHSSLHGGHGYVVSHSCPLRRTTFRGIQAVLGVEEFLEFIDAVQSLPRE